MFASCPLDSNECTQNPTSLMVATGANIDLNATVVFSLGGSCGFLQPLTFVTLEKVNNLVGQSNVRLLSCPVDSQAPTECSNERVSLSRGIHPGYQFVFTILTANSSDDGEYDVVVEGTDVETNSDTLIRKRFNVQGIISFYTLCMSDVMNPRVCMVTRAHHNKTSHTFVMCS